MISFQADDGFELQGHLYGDPATAKAGLLIAPAMGVEQRYYAAFARWMASQGWLVLSFDYRGMGASRPESMKRSLRGLDADIRTWAEHDAAAALSHLNKLLGDDREIHWLGHSLGGQILGLLPNRSRVSRAVTVGCGSGYWRENSIGLRRYVWWLWYVIVPLALPLFGYFPGRKLRKVGDLPRGVMAQWRRWCLDREYMMGEGGDALRAQYASLSVPMLSPAFTDMIAVRNAVAPVAHALATLYTGMPVWPICFCSAWPIPSPPPIRLPAASTPISFIVTPASLNAACAASAARSTVSRSGCFPNFVM